MVLLTWLAELSDSVTGKQKINILETKMYYILNDCFCNSGGQKEPFFGLVLYRHLAVRNYPIQYLLTRLKHVLVAIMYCRDCVGGTFFPSPSEPQVRRCAEQCSATTLCGTAEVPPEHLKVGGT